MDTSTNVEEPSEVVPDKINEKQLEEDKEKTVPDVTEKVWEDEISTSEAMDTSIELEETLGEKVWQNILFFSLFMPFNISLMNSLRK